MSHKDSSNRVYVWRLPGFNNLELLHACYTTQNFTRHTHEQFALGVIEAGALAFNYRGENLVAPAGSVNLCHPGEAHNGHAAGGSWAYRMFYFDPALLQDMAGLMAGKEVSLPFIKNGVLHDARLAAQIAGLHRLLENGQSSALEREHHFEQILIRLIKHHAHQPPALAAGGVESSAVRLIRDYIEDHYRHDISGDELSRASHLSRFHLNRVFCQATGIPPYAYLRQVRIRQAKKLLAEGKPIAAAAAQSGFSDQSHLTRWFKRLCGFTPGEYSNSVQYAQF